ncbi:hypothetical protein ACWEV4_32385, partial [Streptomyces sp. NPDC003860]
MTTTSGTTAAVALPPGGFGNGIFQAYVNGEERPAELHLDRLSAILAQRRAYAILVVASGGFA